MSTNINSPRFLKDFSGRRMTACAIIVAAFGSASLNIWGASQIFPNAITATIFGVVIGACEVIAALSLRHIVADFENNRYWKARLASVMLVLAVCGCVISGDRAFHTLFLEAEHNHKTLQVRAVAAQKQADKMLDAVLAANDDHARGGAQQKWEAYQSRADEAQLRVLKAKPPHVAIIYVLLTLFEMVKIGGLYALATATTKGWTHAQRKAHKRQQEIKQAKDLAKFKIEMKEAEENNVFEFRKEA